MDIASGKYPKQLFEVKHNNLFVGIGLLFLSIFVCIALIVFIIIPQFSRWMEMNTEIKETRERIQVMQSNLQTIQSIDSETVDANLVTASSALPVVRDYSGAMQGVLSAAVQAGVSLESFTFNVGIVATKSASIEQTEPMIIEIDAVGEAKSIKDFIFSLYSFIPLSQITRADSGSGGGSTKLTVAFPSKPLPQQPYVASVPIPQMNDKQRETLLKVEQWKQNIESLATDTGSSTSASLPPPF